MEKCCDACGDGEYYFRSGCSALSGAGVLGASISVDLVKTGGGIALWIAVGARSLKLSNVYSG
jgi:hypothetical protein